ncbi:hypothetical protein BSLA_02f4435 [Burkholderia stabilis]|nr:hypothetical protein BSLA_02f4435 [Burkholderia stabilis]
MSNDTPPRALLALTQVEIDPIGELHVTFTHTGQQQIVEPVRSVRCIAW